MYSLFDSKKFYLGTILGLLGASVVHNASGEMNPEALSHDVAFKNEVGSACKSVEVRRVLGFTPLGDNKLVNGSFELGLGPSGYFPGYRIEYVSYSAGDIEAYKNPPPLPKVVSNEKHSGSKSLCIEMLSGRQKALLYVAPPNLLKVSDDTEHHFSLWVKASRTGLVSTVNINKAAKNNNFKKQKNKAVGTEWQKISGTFLVNLDTSTEHASRKAPSVRLDISSKSDAPYKIWIDDVIWSFNTASEVTASGPVEVAFTPISRQGSVLADRPHTLSWNVKASQARKVETTLYLRDITRNCLTTHILQKKVNLTDSVLSDKSSPLLLKRGHYLAILAVKDMVDGEIIATAKQRFSVMSDLFNLPRTVGYDSGAMYYFEEPFAFCWRGPWSIEEQYKMNAFNGCFIMRDLNTWLSLEPEKGKYDWPLFDLQYNAAHKYRCGFMHELPGVPFKIRPADYKKAIKTGDRKNFNWIIHDGILLGEKKRIVTDEWVPDFKNETFWFAPKKETLKVCREFTNRYKDKGLFVVEFKNECNAMTPANIYIDKVMKLTYPVFKEVAPNLPVITNNTGGNSTKYLEEITKLGGLKYMDGFSFHPYAHADLKRDSLADVRIYRDFADKHAKGTFYLGQTEVMHLSPSGTIARMLSDWVGGGRWSAGMHWRNLSAAEHGAVTYHRNTGPMAPSQTAVLLNGMNRVLAGAKLVGSVKQFNDVLIGLFERELAGGGKEYIAALIAAQKDDRAALIENINFSRIPFVAYDQTGEAFKMDINRSVLIANEVFYLVSSSKALVKAFKKAERRWVLFADNKKYSKIGTDDSVVAANKLFFGDRPFTISCHLTEWKGGGCYSLAARAKPSKVKPVDVQVGSNNISLASIGGGKYKYLATAVYSSSARKAVFIVSTSGVSTISFYNNGKHVIKNAKIKEGVIGEKWNKVLVSLQRGENRLEMLLLPSAKNSYIRTALIQPINEAVGKVVSEKEEYKNRTVNPGVTLELVNANLDKGDLLTGLIDGNQVMNVTFRKGKGDVVPELRFEFADKKSYVINQYFFIPRLKRGAAAWSFDGSNDKSTWDTLHKVRNFDNSKKRVKYTMAFENTKAYKFYRFALTKADKVMTYKEFSLHYVPR